MFSAEQKEALSAKLDRSHVKERSQAGRQLSYIEAWWAIAEANRIFGFEGWDRQTLDLRQLGDAREVEGKWRVAYMAKVRITVTHMVQIIEGEIGPTMTVTREGCGYGSGIDRDLGSAHESALKEAESDAMKRALMTFGNPFGLALYDKTQGNVQNTPPSPQEARTAPSGVKRLTSARAKEIGLDAKLKGLVAGCADEPALDMLDERFDIWTAETPLSWLDSIHNMIELRREEIRAEAAHRAMDDEYRAVMA